MKTPGRRSISFTKTPAVTLSVLVPLKLIVHMLGISFTNIEHPSGSIYVGIYNCKPDFLKPEKACLKKIIPVSAAGSVDFDCTDLGPGTYAVSCFHDLNGNGKLDTNLFGIPTEPYGFSNNVRPKFRAPNWDETRFELKDGDQRISIRLEKW